MPENLEHSAFLVVISIFKLSIFFLPELWWFILVEEIVHFFQVFKFSSIKLFIALICCLSNG